LEYWVIVMPDELSINEKLGFIEINSFGVVSVEDVSKSINQINNILKKTGINKLLFNSLNQKKIPKTFDIHSLISKFSPKITIAILRQESQATADDMYFVETVGLNKGLQIKIFNDRAMALQWLSE